MKDHKMPLSSSADESGDLLDRVVHFPDCETAEPTIRQMIRSYYIQGLMPDTDRALKCAVEFISTIEDKMRAKPDYKIIEELRAENAQLRRQVEQLTALQKCECDTEESCRALAEAWAQRDAAVAQVERAAKALQPFANCVYNDNGNVTITTSNLRIEDYVRARTVLKR
jgi:hypothetical protein